MRPVLEKVIQRLFYIVSAELLQLRASVYGVPKISCLIRGRWSVSVTPNNLRVSLQYPDVLMLIFEANFIQIELFKIVSTIANHYQQEEVIVDPS